MRDLDSQTKVDTIGEWQEKRLGDICRAVGGGTPSRSQPKYWNGEIPWATVKDFTDESVVLSDTREYITREGLENSAATLVAKDSPVVCTRMAVGRCALTKQSTAINQDLKALLLNDEVDPRFFIRLLRQHKEKLDCLSIGTTVRGITLSDLLALSLRYPWQKVEQSHIATVLDTVDEVIGKTEAVIAKLKQVRAGLLHDLLTRGLDENGQLRDPSVHPEQFQDSPLGQIPKEWKSGPFRELGTSDRPYLKTGPFGSSLKQEHWVPEGVPVVTIGSLGEGEFIASEILHVSEETARVLAAYSLLPGDIVFSRVADVGRSVVVTELERGWIMSSNMMWISVDQRRANPQYVQLNISANAIVRRQIERLVNSAGREVANAGVMNSLQLPWAPPTEQIRIVEVLRTNETNIRAEQIALRKLSLLKYGLMNDLLIGRVRVPEAIQA